MPKTNNFFKQKTKSKKLKEKTNIYYVRDFYLKDFKYLDPEYVGVNKNERRRNFPKRMDTNRIVGCKLFAKLWLIEVMKGLKQFLYEGSLHGVKYIFEPTFSRKERLTWVIIVGVSIAFCAVNITKLLFKYTSTPYVNIMDSLPTPVWTVPFPTVVLCPHIHVKSSFANVSNLNNLERFFAGLICPEMKIEKIRLEQRMTEEEMIMLQDFLVQGSPSCKEVVRGCRWRTSNRSEWSSEECCEELLTPTWTTFGLCFGFNSMPLSGFTNETLPWVKTFNPHAKAQFLEWNLDEGYPNIFPYDPNVTPRRTKAAGEASGFGVDLYLNISEHQVECEGNNFGFTVLIMTPSDNVFSSTVFHIPMNKMASIKIDPTTYKTEGPVRALEPNKRQCYFQNEKKLQNFAAYSVSNCKFDSFVQKGRETCKCVMYSWPRKDISQRVCATKSEYDCIHNLTEYLEEQLMYEYSQNIMNSPRRSEDLNLSCYPSCNAIVFASYVLYSNMAHGGTENITYHDELKKKKEFTQLNVHFQNALFVGQHRHVQYDDYYFAGAIGGILSLFLGFSIISVAEFIYFVVLKPILVSFSRIYTNINLN